ncbi:MAG TPA: EI24 domain-containing protein [Polyangiaceae bacterium]|nr:EI24 domain-containing protein [Polyangiaceae bacterium]
MVTSRSSAAASGADRMGSGGHARGPSLVAGVGALLAGAWFVVSRRRAWPSAAVPVVIFAALSVAALWLSFDWAGPWLGDLAFARVEGTWTSVAKSSVRWLGSLLAAYLSVLLALALTPGLSAPALEHLVRLQEEALGAPPRPRRGFWFELRCELEAQLAALALLLPLALVLWLLGLLLPLLLPLVAVLHGVLVSLAVAWNLLGYPLTLRGVRARERLGLMARHAPAVLGFGAAFAAASLVPGAALVLLPAGVVGATRLSERMLP